MTDWENDYELPGGGPILRFDRQWCYNHLFQLKDEWPKGAGIAMMLLLDAFLQDQRVVDMAPKNEDGSADVKAIGRLVAECSPLCCFVGDEIVNKCVSEALAGEGPRFDEIKRRNAERGDKES